MKATTVSAIASVVIATVVLTGLAVNLSNSVTAIHTKLSEISGEVKVTNNSIKYVQKETKEISTKVEKVDARLTREIAELSKKVEKFTTAQWNFMPMTREVRWFPDPKKLKEIFSEIKDASMSRGNIPVILKCSTKTSLCSPMTKK